MFRYSRNNRIVGSENRRGVTGGRTATITSPDGVGRDLAMHGTMESVAPPTVVLSMCAQGVEENMGHHSFSDSTGIFYFQEELHL